MAYKGQSVFTEDKYGYRIKIEEVKKVTFARKRSVSIPCI